MTPILQMRGIAKRFGGVHALKGVDFSIAAGEVVALVGENGAGKSTLMKTLAGVHQPDAGEIRLDGKPATIGGVADATRYGIGFIHQELNVVDNLDVASNVFLGREPRKGFLRLLDQERMRREARTYLDRLGLDIPANTSLERLSIAQQQMIEIAKALSLDARILIMDEPTSSLTLQETAKLLEVVSELRLQGVAIVYISHRLNEVTQIADRAVVLRDGANAGDLAQREITHDNLVRTMVGRDLEHAYQRPATEAREGFFRIERLRTSRYPQHALALSIGAGEILGLAGLVGAGRSELAQAIFGVDRAAEALLTLDDTTIEVRSPRDAIRQGIYLVPEDRRHAGLHTGVTIRENVTLPALERYSQTYLVSRAKETAVATEVCGRLKVKTPNVEVKAGNLSGGNQQKVVLAKWLSLNPKVIIFDEPTRGVDVGAKSEIYDLMRSLAAAGVAILMISSDMEEVLQMSDRVAVMHEGKLTGVLAREGCTEQNVMRLAVGGH